MVALTILTLVSPIAARGSVYLLIVVQALKGAASVRMYVCRYVCVRMKICTCMDGLTDGWMRVCGCVCVKGGREGWREEGLYLRAVP